MIDGTSIMRTIVASTSTANASPSPNIFTSGVGFSDERAEHEDHDQRGRRDRPARCARVRARPPCRVSPLASYSSRIACEHEHLVVHREAEQHREHHHGDERDDGHGAVEPDERPWPSPTGTPRRSRRTRPPTDSRFITAAVSGMSTEWNTSISSRNDSSTTAPMKYGSRLLIWSPMSMKVAVSPPRRPARRCADRRGQHVAAQRPARVTTSAGSPATSWGTP